MNIEEFIWRMCVSFRRLNRVAKPFTFPILRCAGAIEDLGSIAFLILWFISLDCRQGFHQISSRHSDQEKPHFLPRMVTRSASRSCRLGQQMGQQLTLL
jgi:hypothetical protein